jgi:hypothetical protein
MRRVAWCIFWALQIAGTLCLMGSESFAITPAGYHCRVFALWVLEPGFVVMQAVTETALAYSRVTLAQMYWLGIFFGVALNALLFWLAVLIFSGKRRRAS